MKLGITIQCHTVSLQNPFWGVSYFENSCNVYNYNKFHYKTHLGVSYSEGSCNMSATTTATNAYSMFLFGSHRKWHAHLMCTRMEEHFWLIKKQYNIYIIIQPFFIMDHLYTPYIYIIITHNTILICAVCSKCKVLRVTLACASGRWC